MISCWDFLFLRGLCFFISCLFIFFIYYYTSACSRQKVNSPLSSCPSSPPNLVIRSVIIYKYYCEVRVRERDQNQKGMNPRLSRMQRASKWCVWGNRSRPNMCLIRNSGAFRLTVVGRVSCRRLSWMAPALQATQIRLSRPLHLRRACMTYLLKPARGGSSTATILLPRCSSQMVFILSQARPRCTSQVGSFLRASSTASSQISMPMTLTAGIFFMIEIPMVPIPHPKSSTTSHSLTKSMIFWYSTSHMSMWICKKAEGDTWNTCSKILYWQKGYPHSSSGFSGGMLSASPLQDKKQRLLSPMTHCLRYQTRLSLIWATLSGSQPSVLATTMIMDCFILTDSLTTMYLQKPWNSFLLKGSNSANCSSCSFFLMKFSMRATTSFMLLLRIFTFLGVSTMMVLLLQLPLLKPTTAWPSQSCPIVNSHLVRQPSRLVVHSMNYSIFKGRISWFYYLISRFTSLSLKKLVLQFQMMRLIYFIFSSTWASQGSE